MILGPNDQLMALSNFIGYDLEAAVPGGVHTALMHNANIGDPYYRFRDVEYRWIAYENWTYYRNFSRKIQFG